METVDVDCLLERQRELAQEVSVNLGLHVERHKPFQRLTGKSWEEKGGRRDREHVIWNKLDLR